MNAPTSAPTGLPKRAAKAASASASVSVSRRRARTFAAGALAAALLCLAGAQAHAQTQADARHPTAEDVKAAYLHKLPGYVEWPPAMFANAQSPLVIGVVGTTEVAVHLATQGAPPGSARPVVVKRLTRLAPTDDVHLLFAAADAWPAVSRQLEAYAERSVLVVAESVGALDAGAMLNFVLEDGRVRFELAPGAAERRGLRFSSRLIAVAQRIRKPLLP